MSDIRSRTLHLGSGIAGEGGRGQNGEDGLGRAFNADQHTLQSFNNGF